MNTNHIHNWICDGCSNDIRLDIKRMKGMIKVDSNGIKGKNHIPATRHTIDLYRNTENQSWIEWECPICETYDYFDQTVA